MSGAKLVGRSALAGSKRSHQETTNGDEPTLESPSKSSDSTFAPKTVRTSSFRNVSACNRCRQRKNRCDFALPACGACVKAGAKCVGFDGKREIPRSYVFYLEQRVASLEATLGHHGINVPPADDVTLHHHHPKDAEMVGPPEDAAVSVQRRTSSGNDDAKDQSPDDDDDTNRLVDRVGMVSTQGTSDPRYLGSASGISFARVVFAAIRTSVRGSSGIPSSPKAANGSAKTSMRDCFFGLNSRTTISKAPFPDKELAMKLVDLYFNHANPQIPVLHRGQFLSRIEQVYSEKESMRSARDLYMLNIVFAIGAGVLLGDTSSNGSLVSDSASDLGSPPLSKKRKVSSPQAKPEEYHASATVHLESFLGSNITNDSRDGFGSGLEELQAVLLLACFALLRPVPPGLWYIVGVAVRLAIDLGLHHEEGTEIDESSAADHPAETVETTDKRDSLQNAPNKPNAKELGRRQWTRDLRRRLFWSTYSLDRIVSVCTGRPFGITDQVITTEFCSVLDDSHITFSGILPCQTIKPSYKLIAHHYFRLRLLQSEILGVLQHRQARQARMNGTGIANTFMVDVPSPYLHGFDTFKAWRANIDQRLLEWKELAPQKEDSGVQFDSLFLELNYWQAIIVLYRNTFTVPSRSTRESASAEDGAYSSIDVAYDEDEESDLIYLKTAEAGHKVLKLYRQLHRLRLVNYTYLATHHLFMAGVSFLNAIWHSQVVRSGLTLEDIDSTVLAARSVLEDLTEHCPPAQACREAFDRMSKATMKLYLSTNDSDYQNQPKAAVANISPVEQSIRPPHQRQADLQSAGIASMQRLRSWKENEQPSKVPRPQFDMNLQNLLSGGTAFQSLPARSDSGNPLGPVDSGDRLRLARQFNQGQTQLVNPSMEEQIKKDPNGSPHSTEPSQSYEYPNEVPLSHALGATEFPELEGTQSGQLDFPESLTWENGGGWEFPSTENLDLGIGMQLNLDEGQRDWSDAANFDLFDGFFFGGVDGNTYGS